MTASGIKLVVVGDGAVGKTCLLVVYAKGEFPKEYVPTVFDNYTAKVLVNGEQKSVQIWDTAGQEELENIRTMSYANTSVFLLCFSVVDRSSFDNIENIWLPEIRSYVSDINVLLVGTKTDLRSDPEAAKKSKIVTPKEGQEKAEKIGAVGYMECSALRDDGVKEVFDAAIEFSVRPSEGGGCCRI
jgi:small GTP-binding protein